MTRDLRKILKMLAETYPQEKYGLVSIIIYDDESGRITDNTAHPHDKDPLLMFESIKELVEHLQ